MSKDTFRTLRVLVVEDEDFSQKIVTMILTNLGFNKIVIAKNGVQALEKLASAPEPIHLVISDIEMPEMGGFELARRIRLGAVEKYKEVPIIMLTGHSTEDNITRGRIHRIQGFVVKPVSTDVLERYIMRALHIK